ncbi:MAG: helix-turn-helix domain-containing protein [bacterium]|nr:helix-turn-helix domain-containing protein [bacterium]
MFQDQAEALLIKAAEETMKRIREDRVRISPHLKPLIGYIADHLFDVDFQVKRMLAECSVRDHTIPTQFATQMGLAPRDFVIDCRLEVAARMLRSSDLPVWRIGMSVGYAGLNSFSRVFKSRYGMGPRDYRKAAKGDVPADTPALAELLTADELEEALAGNLDPADAESLAHRLRAIDSRLRVLYPNLRQPEVSVRPVAGAEFMEEVMAERLWERIRSKPWNEQRTLVKSQFCFSTPALFELMLRKSREEGRADRSLGVEIAYLALDSLDALTGPLTLHLPHYRARGLSWLGSAHRFALNYPEAEEALNRADTEWRISDERNRDPAVLADIIRNKAALRLFQRRFGEANDLITSAFRYLADCSDMTLLVETLILRGTVECYACGITTAIATLREAEELTNELADDYLRLFVVGNLANAHVELEDYRTASEYLMDAKLLAMKTNNQLAHHQLEWTEGSIAAGLGNSGEAESLFHRSRLGFSDLAAADHYACVSLELCILLVEQNRSVEVADTLVEVVAILEPFQVHREINAALILLRGTLERNEFPLGILRQAKEHLEEYRQDPAKKLGDNHTK